MGKNSTSGDIAEKPAGEGVVHQLVQHGLVLVSPDLQANKLALQFSGGSHTAKFCRMVQLHIQLHIQLFLSIDG
jgi:hypothetical protein